MTNATSFERIPQTIVFEEEAAFKDTYGGAPGTVVLQGMLFRPQTRSDAVLISMHPTGGTGGLGIMRQFAEAGVHVFACDSRYRGADYALIMEKVALDLGAAVRHARDKLGYRTVVLLGWSGGGSLSAFYQAEAERPTITRTPAGDGPDLTAAGLTSADAVVFMAAHVSRHLTLAEWIDGSITNEDDPDVHDPAFDVYDAANGPVYAPAWVQRYRAAQIARVRRITGTVKDRLERLRSAGRCNDEFAFVVHGTMADPRWLDPTIDANDRRPGWCYLGDPKVVNMSPIGLARFSTLRSWLSQWSYDDAQADGPRCVARITTPVLLINNTADDACTPSHAKRLFDAISHDNKRRYDVVGATHYYQGQPELGREAVGEVRRFLTDYGLGG